MKNNYPLDDTTRVKYHLVSSLHQIKKTAIRNPVAFSGAAFGLLVLSSADMVELIPGLNAITDTPYFNFFHEVHSLLIIGIILLIAYRWYPVLGFAGLTLYTILHIPYFLLDAGEQPLETVHIIMVIFMGVAGTILIDKTRRIQAKATDNNQRLGSLYRTSQEMSQSLDMDAVTSRALEATLGVLNLDAGTIRYIDETAQEAAMLSHFGLPKVLVQEIQASPTLKLGQGIAGEVAQSGKPLVIKELADYGNGVYKAFQSSGFQSAAALPLKVRGKVVGVITGFSYQQRSFSPADLDLMASLGSMVGMTIANSRLFSEVETKGKEWERTFDSVSEGIALLTPDRMILRANWALARMLNTTPKTLAGQRCYQVFYDSGFLVKWCPGENCTGENNPCEVVMLESRIGDRWLQMHADPVLGPKGERLSIVHTTRDITELKKTEEALTRSLSIIEAVLDMVQIAGSGLITKEVYTAFTSKLLKLVPFDEARLFLLDHTDQVFHTLTVRVAGELLVKSGDIPRSECKATEWLILQNKPHMEKDIAEKSQLAYDEGLVREGYRAILRLPLSFSGQPFGSFELKSYHPGVYGKAEQQTMEQLCNVIAQTIWYQHVVTLEVAERRELQEMDEARERFIAFLAHELRSPLTPVVASANLLALQFPKETGSPEYRCIHNIIRGAKTLDARLSDLLDIAQYRLAAFSLQLETVDFASLINDVVSRFESLAKDNGQNIKLDMADYLPSIRADSRRLEQIIVNLLDNAVKFTPRGGGINLSSMVDNNNMIIKIQNDGPGIPEEERAKLFQPYWRGKSDRLRLRGSGFGLAICKRLVEAHGGKIWVENMSGMKGSTFVFMVPLGGPTTKGED